MLQARNLDDQRFEDIVAHAVGRIPQLCPQWTNHNPSDPGITLVELLAWYKEMQQYHMNCCTDDIRRKLLRLAGGDIRPAAPAHCLLRLPPEAEGVGYPALTRLSTPEGVVFELAEAVPAHRWAVEGCWVERADGRSDVRPLLGRRDTGVRPFEEGGRLRLALRGPAGRDSLRLWFEVAEPALPPRNPFSPAGRPPRDIRWSWEGLGEARVLEDETWGLSQSGFLTLQPPEGEGLFQLLGELCDPGCEEQVCLSGVEGGRCRAVQRETRAQSRLLTAAPQSDCTLLFDDALARQGAFTVFARTEGGWEQWEGTAWSGPDGRRGVRLDLSRAAGDGAPNLRVVCADPIHYADLFHSSTGLPDQTIPLSLGGRQVLGEELSLICDTLQPDGSIRPERWRCVEDLYAAGPRDQVFVYDPVLELIRMGDGRHGAVVPRGERAILVSDLVLSDCGAGNIPEGHRLRLGSEGLPVYNATAVGGADRESTAEAVARFLRRLEQPRKCVTAADYETQARQTPGLRVAAARAIPGYDPMEPTGHSRHPVVTVVVMPANHSPRPMPDARFLAAVQAHLDGLRPIGTVVRVTAPRYVGVTVSAQLRTAGPVDEGLLHRAVERCLGVGRNERGIGDPVELHRVAMELQQVAGVLAVERLQLDADSAGCVRTEGGDLQLPAHAVACLKGCRLSIR